MEIKEYYYDSIINRTSRRTYDGTEIYDEILNQINEFIEKVNIKSNLNIRLIKNANKILSGFKASYGIITGANTIIALVGNRNDKDLEEKIGYYGEFINLEAVSKNLGTCWVSGTYNKEKCIKELNLSDEEKLVCILVIGNVKREKSFKEKIIGRSGAKKKNFDESLLECDVIVPDWIGQGIEYAILAPSAMNVNPVGYSYRKGELSCFVSNRKTNMEEVDIGISMAHFRIGAHKEGVDGFWERKKDKYIFSISKIN